MRTGRKPDLLSLVTVTTLAIIGMQTPAFSGGPDPRENNESKAVQADFRAVGNEPGWNLEIRNQEKIILVTNYGSKKYEFDLPEADTDMTTSTTRYKAELAGQEMILTISAENCQDTMSGEEFTSKVEVVFNGKTLRGCGRARH